VKVIEPVRLINEIIVEKGTPSTKINMYKLFNPLEKKIKGYLLKK